MQAKSNLSREDVFKDLPIPSALAKMVLPAVASQLIVLIYNMADTFFVGQTNNPYMVAATSLILPVFNITLCLAGLAGIGGGSLISRLLGQGDEAEARRVSAFSLYLGLAVGSSPLPPIGPIPFWPCWAREPTPMPTHGSMPCASSWWAACPRCSPTCFPTLSAASASPARPAPASFWAVC